MSKKFTSDDARDKLTKKINSVQSYSCLYKIAEIISKDPIMKNEDNYMINDNGLHILTKNLSEKTLIKLNNFLNSNDSKKYDKKKKIYEGPVFNTSVTDSTSYQDGRNNVRMSSREKKLIKKMHEEE